MTFEETRGESVPEITYAEAIREAFREEMRRDETIFLLGEEVGRIGGVFAVTRGLQEEFGQKRVRDTPVSEAAIIGASIGAAVTGMRPVAEIMMIDFITVAMDQVVNQAAKMRYMFGGNIKMPLVIRSPQGTGRSAAAQHSQSLEAWFVHVPGLYVAMPSTPYDAKGLLKTALRGEYPVVFLEHKLLYPMRGSVPEEEYLIPFGQADIKRQGGDVTIVATSLMVSRALSAAERLMEEGINAEVVDPRTLNPLDMDTIAQSVRKTHRALIVHEACRTGGVGAEIAAQITEEAFDWLDAPVKRVAAWDVPIPFSPPLEKAVVPSEEQIIRGAREITYWDGR